MPTLKTLLGSDVMNFNITFLKILQKAELLHYTSRLFHSIITAGKKNNFEKVCFCLQERDLTFLDPSCSIKGAIFWN